MEELFIESKVGNIHLDESIVNKYHLEKGTFSPYTNSRIINGMGDFVREKPPEEEVDLSQKDDEIDEMENGLMLSTSEMLDIAAGVDSDI